MTTQYTTLHLFSGIGGGDYFRAVVDVNTSIVKVLKEILKDGDAVISEEGRLKLTADGARHLAYESKATKEKEHLEFFDSILDTIRLDASAGGRGFNVTVPNELVSAGKVAKIIDSLRELGFEVSSSAGGRYNEIEHSLSISW